MRPYISILHLLDEIGPITSSLIIDILLGATNQHIQNNKYHKLIQYGAHPLVNPEILQQTIDQLRIKKWVEQNDHALHITQKGKQELLSPTSLKAIISKNITFNELPFERASQEQKQAICSPHQHTLVIAGAGSGKTTVIINRMLFLTKYQGVKEKEIIALTFTNKAKQDMQKRLYALLPQSKIKIYTFHGFCEMVLRQHQEYTIMTTSTKVALLSKLIQKLDINISALLKSYFKHTKSNRDSEHDLFFRFALDMYSVLDYQRSMHLDKHQVYEQIMQYQDKSVARQIISLLTSIDRAKKHLGLRDFTDLMTQTVDHLSKHPNQFNHVLVDEYQDINHLQYQLICHLKKNILFAVGDPRQAIYEWRGAVLKYISEFSSFFPNAHIMYLTKNYRSTQPIVELANKVIKPMKLPALQAHHHASDQVNIIHHPTEEQQVNIIVQSIQQALETEQSIMVLARTNKQLDALAQELLLQQIPYTLDKQSRLSLMTIHAVKGLEADIVYVIGASNLYHPIKVSDHPLMSLIKQHDTKDEELRLFYVALTRARKKLIISYVGSLTSFLPQNTDVLIDELFKWRETVAASLGIPPYLVIHGKLLRQIAYRKPRTVSHLQKIVAPQKLQRFEREIISVVQSYM